MALTFEKVDPRQLCGPMLYSIHGILTAVQQRREPFAELQRRLSRCLVYVCREENAIAACAVVECSPHYPGKALIIRQLMPHWDHNRDEVLEFLLAEAIRAACSEYPARYALLETDLKHEPNLAILRRAGFRDSLFPPTRSREHCILILELDDYGKTGISP